MVGLVLDLIEKKIWRKEVFLKQSNYSSQAPLLAIKTKDNYCKRESFFGGLPCGRGYTG
jgi:hypothetical protein